MGMLMKSKLNIACISLLLTSSNVVAKQTHNEQKAKPAQQVYFGDTHMHTRLSGDARGYGLTLGPEDAYRVARGEELTSATGQKVKLATPLDFLVVADHAEGIGIMDEIIRGNADLNLIPQIKTWHEMLNKGGKTAYLAVRQLITAQGNGQLPKEVTSNLKITKNTWHNYIEAAEQYNEPGKFTSLLGFEWSAMRKGNNLHRVVIYRDGGDKVSQTLPIDSNRTNHDPEQLWQALAAYEENTGGQVLAIPHNGNLSNGMMFSMTDLTGTPISKAYAKTRARWEPLFEVSQIKGDSETHPLLSPNDEFADYERWDVGNLALTQKKENDMLAGEYARSGLKRGLLLKQQLGINPFKVGMIASSDSHTAIPVTDENKFLGKHVRVEPSANRWQKNVAQSAVNDLKIPGWMQSASGLTAVWANNNTREDLFDAMKRKEVYGTTGPRIQLRFFASWDFIRQDATQNDFVNIGYSKGVPMGSDLLASKSSNKPSFIFSAAKDPNGANLDRIQIIKGWLDAEGVSHEKVVNVSWSGERKLVAGKLTDVGNTVDVANATWRNTIGSAELRGFWQDNDFSTEQQAFYYVRVIEIPTPRWTAYDAKKYQVKMPKEVPMITRERAYSSPIWYEADK